MVNWKRLGLSVLCTAILLGGLEVLALLPLKVFLTLIVVGLVFFHSIGLLVITDG